MLWLAVHNVLMKTRPILLTAPGLQAGCTNYQTNALVSSLYLAGTHVCLFINQMPTHVTQESCALYGIFSTCQTRAIIWQLQRGVRFLDVRFALKQGKLKVYHGIANQHRTAESLFDEIYDFLERYPSECIICSVKQEDVSVLLFEELMGNLISANPSNWFLAGSISDIR